MSLRIVPQAKDSGHYNHTSSSAPSAPGVHDVLRHGVGPVGLNSSQQAPVDSTHPLEARLRRWDDTQRALRQQILRRNLGKAEPIRRDMELKIIRDGEWRPVSICGPQASIHEDILLGKDDTIDWGDIFSGVDMRSDVEIHDDMEARLNI
jgi:proteasome maturation protein